MKVEMKTEMFETTADTKKTALLFVYSWDVLFAKLSSQNAGR